MSGATNWWSEAVVYQVYPRSFQDSDGDGVGDLRGVLERLDYLAWLGADAIWLSPFYPSPGADLGYDISDHCDVDPQFGTMADFDELLAGAHRRGIRVLLDIVPSHTSIEHPWFREHPDWYVWAEEPPNNWRASFGGPAWSLDRLSGRWYLHSFYPEQPDLDWRNPEVREAVAAVLRFWLARGVDGFRLDALDKTMKNRELADDAPAPGPPPLPLHPELAALDGRSSRNDPEVSLVLAALREAAGDALLVGEVYLSASELPPYLEHLDLAFSFDLLHSRWSAAELWRAIEAGAGVGGAAWVLSNHDFPRLATRFGERAARAAALLLLALPGPAFIYQGDEIGMVDGPGARPPIDRYGRDAHRHPMQWEGGERAGFTTGDAWLALADPQLRNVADQRRDRDSVLALYRRLIEFRRRLSGPLIGRDGGPGVLAFDRGEHSIVINLGDAEVALPVAGEVVIATSTAAGDRLLPNEAVIVRRLDV